MFKCKQNYVDRVYGVQTHPAMGFTVLEKVFKKDKAYRKHPKDLHPKDRGAVQRNEQRQRRMNLIHQL